MTAWLRLERDIQMCGLPGFGVVFDVGRALMLRNEVGVVGKFRIEY